MDLVYNKSKSKFYDPFFLPSTEGIPQTLDSALDLALFLYFKNPEYRQASKRMIAHFVTDFDLDSDFGDANERDQLYDYLDITLDIRNFLQFVGEEFSCFQGDTSVPTLEGVFPIRELAGRKVHIINQTGNYVPVEFKSHGKQPLMEVELSDGQKFLATPEHKWIVKNNSSKIVEKTTEELLLGYKIPRQAALNRPDKNDDYFTGIRHGFIFGDGTTVNAHKNTQQTRAYFCCEKDKEMFQFFEDHHNPIRRDDCETRYEKHYQSGHPDNYKELPSDEESASYWYGFVSGFLAADGHADERDGCVSIAQKHKHVLDAVAKHLPRIGMIASSEVGGPYERDVVFEARDGYTYEVNGTSYHVLRIQRNTMRSEDFLLSQHRSNFEANEAPDSTYGKYVSIRAIRNTDRYEEVFCCLEPDTHTFTVGNGILTKQCYGNAFIRMHIPFDRFLVDRRFGKYRRWSIKKFGYGAKFNIQDMTYTVQDPVNPGQRVSLPFMDFRSKDPTKIKMRLLDPRRMLLHHSFISGDTRYIYRFEEWFKKDIKNGKHIWQVNETPLAMLEAIKNGEDFLFNAGEIFHYKAPVVSGISNQGWGLPEVIANYSQLHQMQVYRMVDEVVGRDYMLPFRLFSPPPARGDDLSAGILGNRDDFSFHVGQMIKDRRQNPWAMHSFAEPINYQEFGADMHKSMVPKELIKYQTDNMLDSFGYPAEIFRGSLQVANIPTALRLFENTFRYVHSNNSNLLRWTVRKIVDFMNKPHGGVSLQMPSMASDLEQKQIYMELSAGGEITRAKAYKGFGVHDPVEEAKERILEDIEIEKARNKIMESYEREQVMGSPEDILQASQGEQGAAGSPAGGAKTTPGDRMEEAEQIAMSLLQEGITDGQRSQELQRLAATDEQMHALVKQKLEEIRNQGASQGRQMANQGQIAPGG